MAETSAMHANIRCRSIIEVLGKPKEHVEKTIKEYLSHIKQDPDFVVITDQISETAEQEGGYFSSFVELEFLSKGLRPLIGFCFNYMPSSIEIEKPEELAIPSHMVNSLLNDLQARLHKVDMIVKQKSNETDFLKKNLRASIRNLILVTLKTAPLDEEKLSKVTGVHTKELNAFLSGLIDEGKIVKNGDTYSLTQ